jgi:iron complex transport system ATP-binding protein
MSVRVNNLTFSYKNFVLHVEALRFEVAKVTSIVGPNGAGKTTLLKCVGAVLPIQKKTLFIDGQDIALMKPRQRARHLSYVPQEHDSAFNYLVRDFVLMGRVAYVSPFALPSKEDIRAADEAIEFVGLRSYAERYYSELSSGERRLVLIARALAQESDILLLDEPTTFLDPKHETEILELTRKLALEMQKTVLVTLHGLEMAFRYSDYMVFMKRGGVVASGKPDEVFREPLLESVYDMKMKIIDWNDRKIVLR